MSAGIGPAHAGKTQLVKGKLAQLPEEMASLSISFNYFTDVISFQKILESPLEKKVRLDLSRVWHVFALPVHTTALCQYIM